VSKGPKRQQQDEGGVNTDHTASANTFNELGRKTPDAVRRNKEELAIFDRDEDAEDKS
jgi:hypothetical protein